MTTIMQDAMQVAKRAAFERRQQARANARVQAVAEAYLYRAGGDLEAAIRFGCGQQSQLGREVYRLAQRGKPTVSAQKAVETAAAAIALLVSKR